jgi:segregation and condensation protein A
VLERRKQVVRIELAQDRFTVAQMMEVLRTQLMTVDSGLDLAEFFESCASRGAMICALLAVLELVRLQAIVLTQGELFGAISLRKHKMFDVVFAGGDASGVMAGGAEDGGEKALVETPEKPEKPGKIDENYL